MRRLLFLVTIAAAVGAMPVAAWAQAAGPAAFADGRKAYDAGQYEKARDLLISASKIAPRNGEVFLLLGKAHYQLGEVTEAIAAWTTTLKLAPGEPYAMRMLKALRSQVVDVDTRIKLIERVLAERLYATARGECQALLAEKALTDPQRAKVLALSAEALLATGRYKDVPAIVLEIQTKHAKFADPVQTALLMGRAKVHLDDKSIVEGRKILEGIVADHKAAPAAVVAQYELIALALRQSPSVASVGELAAWTKAHPDHRLAIDALRQVVRASLALTRRGPRPLRDAALAATDVAALTHAAALRKLLLTDAEVIKLAQELRTHFEAHYAGAGAVAAAIQGDEALLTWQLPAEARLAVLEDLVGLHLALTSQGARPARDAKLAASDLKALDYAGRLLASLPHGDRAGKVVQQLVGHFSSHYIQAGAYAAAFQGDEALLKLKLPRTARAMVFGHLVDSHLALTRESPPPAKDAPLAAADVRALAYAKQLCGLLAGDAEVGRLMGKLYAHLAAHYAKAGAHAAAVAGAAAVAAFDLPRASRLTALRTLASYRTTAAMVELERQADAGALPRPLPDSIRGILALYATINTEYPAQPAWADQIALAKRIVGLAARLPAPVKVTALSVPDAWAVEIALAAVRGGADRGGSAPGKAFLDSVRKRYAALKPPVGLRIGVDLSTRLVAAAGDDHPLWATIQLEHADMLGWLAVWQFNENVRTGAAEQNAKLSDTQKEMIAALVRLVRRNARAHAATALNRLTGHLRTWEARAHYAAAQEAYELLAATLPEAVQREVKLAVAGLWIRQVTAEHARLRAVGLKLPEKLDPTLVKALKRCYELQAGLEESDAFLKKVRGVWEGVLNHYVALEYYATVAAAIQVKADKPVAAADRYAQLQLANHRYAEARRELARLLRQYNARAKVTLTPAFEAALAAQQAFITKYPDSPLTATAVQTVFSIAQTFEQYDAHAIAAGIYKDFAAFAGKIKTLADAAPGQVSVAERAALAAAAALDARARKALAKELADRTDKTPPAKIRPEFTAAIAAYKQFVQDRPTSALSGEAVRKIMAVALEYAKVGAWDVAEAIFADLAKGELKLADPERIEFCRGLCHVGKVMPDHARSVLSALVSGHGRPKGKGAGALVLSGPAGDDQSKEEAGGRSGRTPPAAKPAPMPATEIMKLTAATAGDRLSRSEGDLLAMTAIRKQQSLRARQVAMLRDRLAYHKTAAKTKRAAGQKVAVPAVPVLSAAELARQQKAFDAAYAVLRAIRKQYPQTPTAEQARGEVLVMIGHWRTIRQWRRAALLADAFLTDNPTDGELPKLRLGIARDYLAWAAQPIADTPGKQQRLAAVAERFEKARQELMRIVKDFADDRSLVQQAQWDIANSFLAQARAVAAFSPILARGQYVRAAKELQAIAGKYADHPKISTIPQMLWDIAAELVRRSYFDEAMIVWNDLTIHYPTHRLADQAAMQIAQTYESRLGRPLRAAEAYLEINFARGGDDRGIQTAIYNIGVRLKGQKRWVEALHVLETFVDSFPTNPGAGRALTMIGQIHQTNEAWEDAIAAYRRVIDEFPVGTWVQEAKWYIAECRINLSQWREARAAYEEHLRAYPKDKRAAEARRRMGILKDLARYQALVDEKGQRKAFDAQFQIARIVQTQLSNNTKAIIEYRKVAANWAGSHLADDALMAVGTIYLSMGETAKGRQALLELAVRYPDSPLADDALYKIGQSYEAEAQRLAGVTRERSVEKAKAIAQRDAYDQVQGFRRRMRMDNTAALAALRRAGKREMAEVAQARFAAQGMQFDVANITVAARAAQQQVETLTAAQLADRQDKINAALRRAVGVYQRASKVAAADKADEALQRMARIYHEKLKDPEAAMATWLEIVRQFSGTTVAEDASWRIAQYYENKRQWAKAIDAYKAFLRNYRRSPKAGDAQFAVAENYEHLGQWIKAMDAYTNYINNFPSGPMVAKAREQISWIKTYRL